MADRIFSSQRINTGRQPEVDLLKAFSIIMMIVTHCIDDLYTGYEVHTPFMIIDDILAQSIGAMGFMICMGIGIVYSRHASPDLYVRRGISLIMTGQLLNIFRYAIPDVIQYAVTGDEAARDHCMLTFSCDILQFAGLFFICMGLFSYLKLKSGHIFAISAVLNIIAMMLKLKINTGYYVADQFFGMFVFTGTESYFPLFHWMIYPAFGMVLGDILCHVKNKDLFYGISLIPGVIIWAVYFYIGIAVDQHVLMFYNEWQSMAYVNIADVMFQLVCNFTMLCICYFPVKILSPRVMKGVGFISKNINRFYCVHSVIIYVIMTVIALTDRFVVNTPVCYASMVVVMALTVLLVWIYDEYGDPLRSFVASHRTACYTLMVVLTVGACAFASLGYDYFPNINNGYGE